MNFMDILYWRDVRVTAAIFVGCILLLTSFNHFTVVTVGTYLLMLALVPPLIYRLVVSAKAAVLKTQCEHPFKEWLACDIESFIGEKDKSFLPKILKNILNECRRILLVEDTIDTIKVLVIVYIASYFGEWFSGITLLFLAVIFTFTVPKIYDMYRADINNLIGKITSLIDDLKKRVFTAIPSKNKGSTSKKSNEREKVKNIEEIPKKPAVVNEDENEDDDDEKEKTS